MKEEQGKRKDVRNLSPSFTFPSFTIMACHFDGPFNNAPSPKWHIFSFERKVKEMDLE